MKVRSLLLAFILSVLFLAGGMATQAQTLDQTLSGCNGAPPLRTIQANPSNYKSLIPGLLPGDRLQLAAGTYTQGLNLWYKNGEPGKCIVIEGPASGSPAIFTGSNSWNIVSFSDPSYIAVRNLSLDGLNRAGDGVKAERPSPARARGCTSAAPPASSNTPTSWSSTTSSTALWNTTPSSSTSSAATPQSASRRRARRSSATTSSAWRRARSPVSRLGDAHDPSTESQLLTWTRPPL